MPYLSSSFLCSLTCEFKDMWLAICKNGENLGKDHARLTLQVGIDMGRDRRGGGVDLGDEGPAVPGHHRKGGGGVNEG